MPATQCRSRVRVTGYAMWTGRWDTQVNRLRLGAAFREHR